MAILEALDSLPRDSRIALQLIIVIAVVLEQVGIVNAFLLMRLKHFRDTPGALSPLAWRFEIRLTLVT